MNHANNNTGFDNEYYLEKGEKKDSKSRGRVAAVQAEAREKKIAEQIRQLPKKMQAKLTENTIAPVANTGKTTNSHVTKTFHSRQKTMQDLLLEEYNEEILVNEDVLKEHIDETFEKRWDEHMDAMKEEERTQEEEERYQTYLGNKYLCEFPPKGMTQWDCMLLKDEIIEYEAEIAEKHKERKYCIFENGEESKAIWLEYNLTKEQYEAYKEYEENCGDLAAFYLEPDYAIHPDYEFRLKTAIKKYEDEWNAQKAREEEVH